jgi:hypothetical protein
VTKSFHAAWVYTALGLLSGLFYREYTKAQDFEGRTQLAFLHTHLLSLGMLFFLVVIALLAVLPLAESRAFNAFFWIYNVGLVVTVGALAVRGVYQVNGDDRDLPALAGIAGLGHLLITVGIVAFFLALKKAIDVRAETSV